MSARRPSLLLSALVLVAACGSGQSTDGSADNTLGLSGLPPAAASTSAPVGSDAPDITAGAVTGEHAGDRVKGNGVILIGDSVLASTASRYGGEMCKALVPLGWRVEVDAETGQFVPWGNDVLDERLSAKWDVGVILLGNNYLGDQGQYRFELERMVKRLSPAVVVLLKVTEFTKNRKDVNAVIDELATRYPNVMVLDWAAVTAADKKLTGSDHLHLEPAGRAKLAEEVAKVMGQAPVTPGKCLSTKYTDDSRSPVTGTTVKGTKATTTTAGGSDTTVSSPDPTPTPTPADPTP